MRKLLNWIDTNHHKGLYELMTNQIYTAVLGSIIYMFFDWGYTVYNAGIYSFDVFVRSSFLLLGIAFYVSDYYYIKGSNPYRKWHFVFDLVFMICMLYSAKVLNVDTKDSINNLPAINLTAIRNCYMIFLGCYLFWDIRELIAVDSSKQKEKKYYYEVIVWEILSFLSLLVLLLTKTESSIPFLVILTISTIWFCFISYRKGNYLPNPIDTR